MTLTNTNFDYAELYLATVYTDGDTTLDCYAKNATYKLTDQKTSSLVTSFRCLGINRNDETQYMGMAISGNVTNGTFQDATRYTLTLRTSDGANPMVGLANTDDGTDADANIITGNKLTSLPAGSKIIVPVGAHSFIELDNDFISNVANRGMQSVIYLPTIDVAVGDDRGRWEVFEKYDGNDASKAYASVATAGVTGDSTIQIHNLTTGNDILSTPITIATTETQGSGVINATYQEVSSHDILRIDVDSVAGTAPKGLIVSLELTN